MFEIISGLKTNSRQYSVSMNVTLVQIIVSWYVKL